MNSNKTGNLTEFSTGDVRSYSLPNGAANVVPGRAVISIDIRAGEDAIRQAAVNDVLAEIERVCARRPTCRRTAANHGRGGNDRV